MNYNSEIYQLAKKGELIALKTLITNKTRCIDEFGEGTIVSAAEQLASENNVDAVMELIDLGANVSYIARGAARGGHMDLVNQLLQFPQIQMGYFAQGFAISGDRDRCEQCIAQGADVNHVLKGAAWGGHQDFLKEILTKYEFTPDQRSAMAPYLVLGENVDLMFVKEMINTYSLNLKGIIYGLALTKNHTSYKNQLIAEYPGLIPYAARGAACGGEKYEIIYKQNWKVGQEIIAEAFAMGGHYDHAESLYSAGVPLEYLTKGATLGHHTAYVNDLKMRTNEQRNDFFQPSKPPVSLGVLANAAFELLSPSDDESYLLTQFKL